VLLSVTQEPAFGAERVLATLLQGLPREFMARCVLLRPPRSALARWTAGASTPQRDWSAKRDASLLNLRACFGAARALRAERVGLVHAWGVRAFEPALLLGRLLGAHVSGTLHDHPRASSLGRIRRTILDRSAPRLRPFVCVSEALAAACREFGVTGDMAVIRNGLPAERPLDARPESGSAAVVRVGFLGLYAPWKGFATVREWIDRAGMAIEWHLYGEPAPSLRAACERLQTSHSNVVLHGWTDRAGSMDEIDILVHASVEFDPFPTVLLEAARAGIPAVASDVGGAREIVADGVTGFLFPPGDLSGLAHLRRLAADPDLRRIMGAAAQRRLKTEFGIERMVDAYMTIWKPQLTPGS
jgi:glycosyltransferase involved in cell wall biosynthesis